MRKISYKSQQKLEWAKQRGIDPDPLVKKYGIRFVMELLNHLTKTEKNGPRTREIIYPSIKKFDCFDTRHREEYFEELEEVGLRIKYKHEDFIDEDTGGIITIERPYLYYLKR